MHTYCHEQNVVEIRWSASFDYTHRMYYDEAICLTIARTTLSPFIPVLPKPFFDGCYVCGIILYHLKDDDENDPTGLCLECKEHINKLTKSLKMNDGMYELTEQCGYIVSFEAKDKFIVHYNKIRHVYNFIKPMLTNCKLFPSIGGLSSEEDSMSSYEDGCANCIGTSFTEGCMCSDCDAFGRTILRRLFETWMCINMLAVYTDVDVAHYIQTVFIKTIKIPMM